VELLLQAGAVIPERKDQGTSAVQEVLMRHSGGKRRSNSSGFNRAVIAGCQREGKKGSFFSAPGVASVLFTFTFLPAD
jgi:hypothetical protein